MKTRSIAFFALIAANSFLSAADERLTEESIRKSYENHSIDAAAKDVRRSAKHLAKNVKIWKVDPDTKEKTLLHDNKMAYIVSVEDYYRHFQAYASKLGPLRIDIKPDGQSATVTYRQTDEWTIDGEKITATITEIDEWVLDRGNALIQTVTFIPDKDSPVGIGR